MFVANNPPCSTSHCRPVVSRYLMKRRAPIDFQFGLLICQSAPVTGPLLWDGGLLIDTITLNVWSLRLAGVNWPKRKRMWRTFVLKYGKAGEKKVNKSNGRSLRLRALVCLQSAVLEKRGSEWWACQLVMGETSQRGRGRTEGARGEGGVVWAINQRCWCSDRADFVWPADYVAAENTAETNLCMLLGILWTPVINQSEDNYITWTSFCLCLLYLPSHSN